MLASDCRRRVRFAVLMSTLLRCVCFPVSAQSLSLTAPEPAIGEVDNATIFSALVKAIPASAWAFVWLGVIKSEQCP